MTGLPAERSYNQQPFISNSDSANYHENDQLNVRVFEDVAPTKLFYSSNDNINSTAANGVNINKYNLYISKIFPHRFQLKSKLNYTFRSFPNFTHRTHSQPIDESKMFKLFEITAEN